MQPQPPLPKGIKWVVYDIDNCAADGSNNDVTATWDHRLAVRFNLPLAEASRLRLAYYYSHGCSLVGFAKEYDLPMSWVDDFYADTGAESAELFRGRHPVNSPLPGYFNVVNAFGIRQGIITQGHPSHYVPITDIIGLLCHVPEEDRIDRTKPDYEKLKPEVWENWLARRNLRPEEGLVFEDTPDNIVWPAKLGIRNVVVGGRETPTSADSIGWRFPTFGDAMLAFITSR